jgi:hypothetical protein
MTNERISAPCRCGKVELQIVGAPILRGVCYCARCQEAGRRHKAVSGLDTVLAEDGGTSSDRTQPAGLGCSTSPSRSSVRKAADGEIGTIIRTLCTRSGWETRGSPIITSSLNRNGRDQRWIEVAQTPHELGAGPARQTPRSYPPFTQMRGPV